MDLRTGPSPRVAFHVSPSPEQPEVTETVATPSSTAVVLAAFAAVENRDDARFAELCDSEAEFRWPPSLPYGGTVRGVRRGGTPRGWAAAWDPVQPTGTERRLDPRVVAATDHEVVVLWQQRGLAPSGERFESEVLGLYRVQRGKLARAQMFYFDPAAAAAFLAACKPPKTRT
jgi:ketosteroid isomerase-like protein